MFGLNRARLRMTAAAAAATVAVGASALVWISSAEAAVAGPGYGYLWLDDPAPTVGVEYTPSTWYQRNSTDAANTVTRRSTGSYDLYFPNLARFGTPMVTAYAGGSERCKVGSWRSAAWPRSGTVVTVRCTSRTGAATNTHFTATYAYATAASASSTGGGSYLWSDRPAPTLGVPYTPNTAFQLNTTGQTNTVTRLGRGLYDVRIEGFGGPGRFMGLTVVATGGSAGTYCTHDGAKAWPTHLLEHVNCYGSDGNPADSAFALTFVESGNPVFGLVAAYANVLATCFEREVPHSTGVYPPFTCNVYDGAPDGTSVSWVSPGVYQVHLPVDMSAGNVQVTPSFGPGPCKVDWWSWDRIQVRCIDRDGGPPSEDARSLWVSFVA